LGSRVRDGCGRRRARRSVKRKHLELALLSGEGIKVVSDAFHICKESGGNVTLHRREAEVAHNFTQLVITPAAAHVTDRIPDTVLVRAVAPVQDSLDLQKLEHLVVHEAHEAALANRRRQDCRDDE
jgi:hypothetical protein